MVGTRSWKKLVCCFLFALIQEIDAILANCALSRAECKTFQGFILENLDSVHFEKRKTASSNGIGSSDSNSLAVAGTTISYQCRGSWTRARPK